MAKAPMKLPLQMDCSSHVRARRSCRWLSRRKAISATRSWRSLNKFRKAVEQDRRIAVERITFWTIHWFHKRDQLSTEWYPKLELMTRLFVSASSEPCGLHVGNNNLKYCDPWNMDSLNLITKTNSNRTVASMRWILTSIIQYETKSRLCILDSISKVILTSFFD